MDRKEVLFKMRLTILLTVFIAALLAASVQTSVAQPKVCAMEQSWWENGFVGEPQFYKNLDYRFEP